LAAEKLQVSTSTKILYLQGMTIVAPAAVVMPFFFGSKANFTDETHNYRMWHLCNSAEKI
jgi:hypothetical protein